MEAPGGRCEQVHLERCVTLAILNILKDLFVPKQSLTSPVTTRMLLRDRALLWERQHSFIDVKIEQGVHLTEKNIYKKDKMQKRKVG